MTEFKAFPKIPRLFRDIVISEKIDGTNAAVVVEIHDCLDWKVTAQSRNRIITPEQDNFGFAKWVKDNALDLATVLGEGYHYGEWWGSGVQIGYGLTKGEKRFSLFNTHRWSDSEDLAKIPGLGVVPVLYSGPFSEYIIREVLKNLGVIGSKASPGFMRPEGIMIYHTHSGQYFKYTFDDGHKG